MMTIPLEIDLARAMEKKGFEVLQAESVQKGIQNLLKQKTRICCC